MDSDGMAADFARRDRSTGIKLLNPERMRIFPENLRRARSIMAGPQVSRRGPTRLACSLGALCDRKHGADPRSVWIWRRSPSPRNVRVADQISTGRRWMEL